MIQEYKQKEHKQLNLDGSPGDYVNSTSESDWESYGNLNKLLGI